MTVHPLDRARLADLARLQRRHRERILSPDDRFGLLELVAVILRRHAGSDARAQAVVDNLLARADAADHLVSPTVEAIIAAAREQSQPHEMTRAVGARRR